MMYYSEKYTAFYNSVRSKDDIKLERELSSKYDFDEFGNCVHKGYERPKEHSDYDEYEDDFFKDDIDDFDW